MALFQPDHAFCIPLILFSVSTYIQNNLSWWNKDGDILSSASLYAAENLNATRFAGESGCAVSQPNADHKSSATGAVTLSSDILFQLINPPHHPRDSTGSRQNR